MEYTTIEIQKLIDKSEDKKLLLPNFQRDFVWDRNTQQKELLSSILYDIPIGSLLILNGESNFFSTKELCVRKEITVSDKGMTLYLLDGQQRISTLKSIFFDFFEEPGTWEENWNNLYPKLRTRWFLRMKPKNNEIDLFGWENLKFNGITSISKYSPKEVIEFIHYEQIHRKQIDKWYHPEYKIEDWYDEGEIKESTRKRIISRGASIEGLVPLYSILGEPNHNNLHNRVLERIAKDRIEELKSDVEDNSERFEELFESKYENCNEDEINDNWNDLENNWVQNIRFFLENIRKKEIPIIELTKDEMSRAIYAFEYINKGGTSLSIYDLIVAKAAHDEEIEGSLTDKIISLIDKEIELPDSLTNGLKNIDSNKWTAKNMDIIKDDELVSFTKNQYLNLLSVFSYCEYEKDVGNIKIEHIKKDKQLELDYKKINENTDLTIESLLRACSFLQFRCGVVNVQNLPYKLMILPIAYILRNDAYWEDEKAIDKIEYWYWSSLFGGSYRERQNEQSIEDIKKLHNFIKNGKNEFKKREKNVLNEKDYSSYETLIFKSESEKNVGTMGSIILQYVLSKQPRDFIDEDINLTAWQVASGKEYHFKTKNRSMKLAIQDHHIYPLNNATKMGESSKKIRKNKVHPLNSPLNRTYISSEANNLISDKNPNDYFKYVSNLAKYGHCIPVPIEEKYKMKKDEEEHKYYERLMKQRFDEIKRDLEQELDKLK